MKKQRILAITLIMCMLVALAGCGEKTQEGGRLHDIKERGYLTVATEPYFTPYEFIDYTKDGDDKYVGADIEFAKYLADKLGVELKIVPLEFTAVLSSITEGKYDLGLSALAYTPTRAEAMALSEGYYFSSDNGGYSLMVREEDAAQYQSFDDFKGKKVVCQAGSIQEAYANSQMDVSSFSDFVRVSSTTDGYLMLSEGKVDAAICAVSNAELYCAANPGLVVIDDQLKFKSDPQFDGVRVGMKKGEEELLAFVNEAIDEVTESGQMGEWIEEYKKYAESLGVK